MALYLGLLIFSFIVTSLFMVPFINFLFRLHFTHHHPITPLTSHESREFAAIQALGKWKIGTPVGGGLLIIFSTSVLYALLFPILVRSGLYVTSVYPFKEELNIIFLTFISFGLLGFYEDITKIFNLSQTGLVPRLVPGRKNLFILLLSLLVSLTLFFNLDIQIMYIKYIGVVNLGWLYIPVTTLIIASFAKSFDITDGMDGLASGVLLICLLAFWVMSLTSLDTVLSVFIALWVGGLLAFLYFNIYPARIWLGNGGSLAFGATLAVVGLLLGKIITMLIVGLIFIVEGGSQLVQIISVRIFKKKLFSVTPLHYWLQSMGWQEPKIVLRVWLVAILLAVIGLWISTF